MTGKVSGFKIVVYHFSSSLFKEAGAGNKHCSDIFMFHI